MTNIDRRRVREVFAQAQHSATTHEKLCKQLKQLFDKMPSEEFLNEFTNCLKVPLIHGDKHSSVENTLNFAAKFSISLVHSNKVSPSSGSDDDEEDEEMCPFVLSIFCLMFEHHNTENQAIRFRVCQFVNKLLNSLGNDACIDDNLCDQISECMMERLQDKAASVRVQALMALHRLQDPTDPNCPVMEAFTFHMKTDPSAEVRRAVITNIAITAQSVREILGRTHDVKDLVRRTAYMTLSKLSVQRFTIYQRVRLLTDGLKDCSEMVRNCVSKIMLPAWLQYYKGSFLSLLHALDCESSTEISILALQTLFKSETLRNILDQLTKISNEDKVIPMEELTPESVLYWRVLYEYLEAHPELADDCPIDEPLPEIVPELTTFCNYIRQFYLERSAEEVEHWVKLQHQYILQQLLEITKGFDLADEMGRTNLRKLCLDLLTSEHVSEEVVPVLVEVMIKVVPDVEARLQSLAEVISEVRDPLAEQETEPVQGPSIPPEEARQRELKQAAIRVKINELKEEQDEAIKDQDFVKAQKLKEEWLKLQQDLKALAEPIKPPVPEPRNMVKDAAKNRVALGKCLRIVREMVQSDTVKSLSATLRSLMQNFVLPCVQEDNSPIIRNKALEALGLFSLLDEDLAKENFVMFCFQIANDEVCEIALKVTFDLLHLYGLETFQVQEDGDGNLLDKKKSKKKKKNLFVTDMYEDEFDDDEEAQESSAQTSSCSSANTANLITMLTSLLDSTSTSMRNLAMEGLYKLLMACRITSSALLSRLILMWFSPVTEGDEALRQPLAAFLSIYAAHCPRSQETLEQAFLPTLRTLMQAPVISPLTQVDQDCVVRLFLNFTKSGVNKYHSKTTHIHNNMAISICNEILNSEDDSTNVSVLLKALNALELSFEDSVFCDELKTLVISVKQLCKQSKDKQNLRYLDRFYQQVENGSISTTQNTEVENTATTNQLEATGPQASVNSTVASSEKSLKQGSSKNARLLHPRMHSLVIANDESPDSDDEDSQTEPPEGSPVIVPPSPPRSQSFSDEESEVGADKAPSQDDAVFKVPLQSNRPKRLKKGASSQEVVKVMSPRRTGGGRKETSSSESDTSSPRQKRRKAAQENTQKQTVTKGPVPKTTSHSSNSNSLDTNSDSSPLLVTRHGRRAKGVVAVDSSPTKGRKGKVPEKISAQNLRGASSVSPQKNVNSSEETSPSRSANPFLSSDINSSPTVVTRRSRGRGSDNTQTKLPSQGALARQPSSFESDSSPIPKQRGRSKPTTSEDSSLSSPSPQSSSVTSISSSPSKRRGHPKPVTSESDSLSSPRKTARSKPVSSEENALSPQSLESSTLISDSPSPPKQKRNAKPTTSESATSPPPKQRGRAKSATSESDSSPAPKRRGRRKSATPESDSSPAFKRRGRTQSATSESDSSPALKPRGRAEPTTSESDSSPPRKQRGRAKPATSQETANPSQSHGLTSESSPASGSPSDPSLSLPSKAATGNAVKNRSPPLRVQAVLNCHVSPSGGTRGEKGTPPSSDSSSTVATRRSGRRESDATGTRRSSCLSPGITGIRFLKRSSPSAQSDKSGVDSDSSPPLQRNTSQSSETSGKESDSSPQPVARSTRQRNDADNGNASPSGSTLQKGPKANSPPLRVQAVLRSQRTPTKSTPPSSRNSKETPSGSSPSTGLKQNSASKVNSPSVNKQQAPEQDRSIPAGRQGPARSTKVSLSRQVGGGSDSSPQPAKRGTRSSLPVSSPDSPGLSTDSDSQHTAAKRGRRPGKGTDSNDESSSPRVPKALPSAKDSSTDSDSSRPTTKRGKGKASSEKSSPTKAPPSPRTKRGPSASPSPKLLRMRGKGKHSEIEDSPSRPPKKPRNSSPATVSPPRTRRESRSSGVQATATRQMRGKV